MLLKRIVSQSRLIRNISQPDYCGEAVEKVAYRFTREEN